MKTLYLEDIDLFELSEMKETDNKESSLFHDNKTVYKIFDDLTDIKRKNKQRKIEILGDGTPLPITVMPKEKLVYGFLNNQFEGNTMDYIHSSQTLYKTFMKNKNLQLFLPVLITISTSLEAIHQDPREIIISDLHAKNIIVDQQLNPYIIDIDSCKISDIKNDAIPIALKQYLLNRNLFTSLNENITNKNTDKLCFLMMFLGLIFNKHIDKITLAEYDKKSTTIDLLKDIKNLVMTVQKKATPPDIPYFHELVKVKTNKRI